jgi:hypothetical protein
MGWREIQQDIPNIWGVNPWFPFRFPFDEVFEGTRETIGFIDGM